MTFEVKPFEAGGDAKYRVGWLDWTTGWSLVVDHFTNVSVTQTGVSDYNYIHLCPHQLQRRNRKCIMVLLGSFIAGVGGTVPHFWSEIPTSTN